MNGWAAALAIVGGLLALNFLLILGVIRRLREHSVHLEALLRASRHGDVLPAIGQPVGEFDVTSTDGQPVTRQSLVENTVVAFFSPGCAPCEAKLPEFLDRARTMPADWRLLGVITGPVEDAGPMAATLRAVVTTVVDGVDGPVSSAFQHPATPSFCLVDGAGRVAAAEFDLSELLLPTRA